MARKFKVKTMQTSVIGGEIDESVIMRIDKEQYLSSLRRARNVYINPQGNASRREGLQYIDGTTSNAESRLIPFEFNNVQAYLLVFTAGEFKVYKDDVLQATITSSPISALTLPQIKAMDFTQSADTLFLFHEDVQTIEITRTGHTAWTAASTTFSNIPPYAFSGTTISEPAAALTLGSVSGRDVTVTAGAAVFNSGHVGQFIISKTGGILYITAYTSTTVVVGLVQVDFGSTSQASGNWELETGYEDVWSGTKGWPSCGTFYQSRLWMAGSAERPQTVWGSKSGSFFDFGTDQGDDDDAIDITLDTNELNAIERIFAGRNLQIFTSGGEFYTPNRETSAITPTNISILPATQHGTKAVLPVSVDGSTLFIDRNGKVIREFLFNDVENSYNANAVSLNAPHLIVNPTQMAVRKSTATIPADFVYLVNTDGTMAVFSALRSQKLAAWSLFTTTGTFEQCVVVDQDVYVVVKRTINSGNVRYIEKLNADYFMDASEISTSGSPTDSWTGFGHLEAETVKVRGDDYILTDATIASGNFTSSEEVSSIEAGIDFAAEIQTLPIDADLGGFTLAGDYRRLVYANVRLLDSRNIDVKVGTKTYKPAFRQFGDLLDAPVSTYSGYKKVYLTGFDREVAVTVTQSEPLEFNVLGMTVGIK